MGALAVRRGITVYPIVYDLVFLIKARSADRQLPPESTAPRKSIDNATMHEGRDHPGVRGQRSKEAKRRY
jgi:hypothetical protein